MDHIVSDVLNLLDTNVLDAFEERAGIMEFNAKVPRGHAECLALLDTLRRHPNALTGLSLLQVGGRGSTRWVLTTDPAQARQKLSAAGMVEITTADIAQVIKRAFGGAALLSPLPLPPLPPLPIAA